MNLNSSDKFFNDVDFVSIVSTIKGIFTSDGAMSLLLDFERVLDEADVYAYKNWQIGELVSGPNNGRYSVSCIFMWPYKLMPDPKGIKRLLVIGCDVEMDKGQIEVPVEVLDYEDFVPGTRYPKMHEREMWFVKIIVPKDLMNDLKEGSIDLADQTIDLQELEDAYEEDLDEEGVTSEEDQNNTQDLPAGQ